MAKTKSTSEKKSRGEKILLWVGSICGILVAVFTLYDKVTTPPPPRLSLTFFESSTETLNLSPSVNTEIDVTEDIPLQLKIENNGGRIAKNVKLYISHYPSVTLTAQYKKEQKRTWNAPNQVMEQVSLALEDLNPRGDSFLVPISVTLDSPRDFQRTLRVPRETLSDKKSLIPREYPLYCDLSSDSSPSTRIVLRIVLGRLDVLSERGQDVFWVGHGKDGSVRVLKAKEDYLNPAPREPAQPTEGHRTVRPPS